MTQYTLGLDIGTTGTKALLVSEKGEVAASANAEYSLLTPRPNWAEQDPETWWAAAIYATRDCLEKAQNASSKKVEVAGVGLSGQMHSSVFLDSYGLVLRPAILWCDQRTEAQCQEITETLGFERLVKLTYNRALAGFTAPKVLWLRENEPEVYARLNKILVTKDYVRYRMTGALATEVSDASGTLLFDVGGRRWSDEVLLALKIRREWLPDCYESPEISGQITRESATVLGVTEGTPVVGGGGDQAAGAVGNGIVQEGLVSCVLGTSGVVFWHSDRPVFDRLGQLHSFCHAVPGKWHLMAVTLAAGGSFRWFRDHLCQEEVRSAQLRKVDPYEVIIEEAASVPPGAEGLIFLPYLAGERNPYADANARGAFLGLSLRHTKAHLARAVLEGVTMNLKNCLEQGRDLGAKATRLSLSGGGARSTLWQQIVSNIFGMEVIRNSVDEGPAFGAALLAAVGARIFVSVEEACKQVVRTIDAKHPDAAQSQVYQRLYDLYRPLYYTLKDFFDRDADFVDAMFG